MPKSKTHSGAKKRFKLTATGRIKRKATNRNHIQAKKAPGRKRRLGAEHYISAVDEPRIKKLLLGR